MTFGNRRIDDERFDIVAPLPAGATPRQIPVMLQHLLANLKAQEKKRVDWKYPSGPPDERKLLGKNGHPYDSPGRVAINIQFARAGIARGSLRAGSQHGPGGGFAANPSEDAPANGAPRYRPGIPNRRSLAVSRLFSGSVAPFRIMLKEPLVPLTRKEGFRCSRARDMKGGCSPTRL